MSSFARSNLPQSLRGAINGSTKRGYAVPSFAPSSASPFQVFDRNLKRSQRDRAAPTNAKSRLTDYVKDDVAQSMVDRLLVSLPLHLKEYMRHCRLFSPSLRSDTDSELASRQCRILKNATLLSSMWDQDLDFSQNIWTLKLRRKL